MSNFKRKINIVESTTSPANQYDWWFNLNDKNIYRHSNGAWEVVSGGKSTTGSSEVIQISDALELRSLILNKQLIPGATYVISSKCIKSDLHYIEEYYATMHIVSSDYDIVATAASTTALDCCAYLLPAGGYGIQVTLMDREGDQLPCQLNTYNINKVGYVWFNYSVAPANTCGGGAIYRADFVSSIAFDVSYPELGEAALYALNKYGEDAWIYPVGFYCPESSYFEGEMFLIGSEKYPNRYTVVGIDGGSIYTEEDIYGDDEYANANTDIYVEFGVLNITNIDNRFDRLYTGKYQTVFIDDYYTSTMNNKSLQIDVFNSSIIIKNSKIVFVENDLAGGEDSNAVVVGENCNIQNSELFLSVDNISNTYLSNYYGPLYDNFSAINSQVGPSISFIAENILWGTAGDIENLFGGFLSNSDHVDLYSSSIYHDAYTRGASWDEDMPVLTEELLKVRLHNIVFDRLSSPIAPPDNYLEQSAWVEPSGGFSFENNILIYDGGSNVKYVGVQ